MRVSKIITFVGKIFTQNNHLVSWILMVIILTLPTVTPIMKPGLFAMHDDIQVMRVTEMTKCLKDGQIPCRWVPNMGYGYGYPQFNYYGPLPYYVMSFANLLGAHPFTAVKTGFILALLLGNISMFLLGKTLWGKWGGLLSAIIYGYAPYRASDVYSRGAMGESWAFVFIPMVILATFNLAKKLTTRHSAFLALSFGALVCTHNISTLIFTPFLLVLFIIFLYQNGNLKINTILKNLVHLGVSLAWGGLIAGFFFIPVVFEKQFAHTETMLSGYFDYRAHFVSITQLFISTFWGVGSSELGPHDDLSFFYGPIMMLFVLASFIISYLRLHHWKKPLSFLTICLFFLGLIASFMSHVKSSFIWSLVGPLVYLQFPWRFLVLGNIFFSLLTGSLMVGQKDKPSKILILITFVFTLLLNLSFFQPSKWFNISLIEKYSGPSWDKQMTVSIFDYLPIFASHPPSSPAPQLPEVANGYVSIEYFKKGTNWMQFYIYVTEDTTLTLQQFDFPGWKVKLDDKAVTIKHQNEIGLITFPITAGKHQVKAHLSESPTRIIGNIATLIFLPLALYYLVKRKHE